MMNATAFQILIVIALILAIAGIVKPAWLCTSVAVLLIGVAVLIGKGG